jgi:hypothetical protein
VRQRRDPKAARVSPQVTEVDLVDDARTDRRGLCANRDYNRAIWSSAKPCCAIRRATGCPRRCCGNDGLAELGDKVDAPGAKARERARGFAGSREDVRSSPSLSS